MTPLAGEGPALHGMDIAGEPPAADRVRDARIFAFFLAGG